MSVDTIRRSRRTPLLRSIETECRREAVAAKGKPYVVFRDGVGICGDPMAREIGAFSDEHEACCWAYVQCERYGRCWVEKHTGTRSRVIAGWWWNGAAVEVDEAAGPTRQQTR